MVVETKEQRRIYHLLLGHWNDRGIKEEKNVIENERDAKNISLDGVVEGRPLCIG
jgi:hypothetical protein